MTEPVLGNGESREISDSMKAVVPNGHNGLRGCRLRGPAGIETG